MEVLDLRAAGFTRQVNKQWKAPKTGEPGDRLERREDVKRSEEMKEDEGKGGRKGRGIERKDTTSLWKDVVHTVPVKGGEEQLLDTVSECIRSGEMTAL
ncbi:hypothetical protein HK097_000779 [Rhizophlyctis rosea]|uniref:Uncharacterized protein n=1 Tax=Rhizophlyctis rosea TaxID=64517 RepID=A0AAD5S7R0_9FUNG|nr:hypothetical protein HK097_000779 [Rhizophlyctis rosea]